MKKIKVAQIGTSHISHGWNVFQMMTRMTDYFEVVGYALPENEREKFPHRMHVFEGYPELTAEEIVNNPEIDAVTIETEEVYLTKYALMAAEHGKHIHMEKPGGTSMAEFEKLIETVKANGTVFHTGYMYRYNPVIIDLMKRIRNGEIGEIISVETQMNCEHSKETRQWLENFPGGIMFLIGCHLVDLILQIQGVPKRIIPLNKSIGLDGVTATDFGMAVMEYEHGISFAKINTMEKGGFARRQLVVTGTKKTVELKPLEMYSPNGGYPTIYTEYTEYGGGVWDDQGEHKRTPDFDRYDDMILNFAKMVRGEIQNPYTYDYELNLYRTILACCGAGE